VKFPRDTRTLESGCIIFLGQNRSGQTARKQKFSFRDDYRCIIIDGLKWSAHRLSYSLNVSQIPNYPFNRKEGLILHTCDNKWCINPDHLYLGNQSQNINDTLNRHPTFRSCRIGRRHSEETKLKISRAKTALHGGAIA
jgi:hypothetical protein